MSTSSAEIVNFFCHACGATVPGPAPSSIFHFTLCPRCGEGYLDDCPAAPNQAPLPAWLLRLPPPPPPWLSPPPSAGSSSRRASASAYSSPWSPPLALLPPPPPLHHGAPPRGSTSPLTSRSSATSTSQQIGLRPPPPPPWLLLPPPPTTLRHSWDDVTSLIPSDEESPPPPPPPPRRPPPVSNSTDHDSAMSQAPAPPESVAALPTVAVSDAALVCPICTDRLILLLPQPAEAARQLPCGHVYHSGCIVKWLSLRNSCPVCRSSIPAMPPPSATTDTAAASSSASPQPEMGRRPRGRRIRRICSRLLRYMDISRGRQANTSSSGDVRVS
ncbi:formin-like protein 14 [Brachypodium distachyon]|uniref:RING-type domain-containing protein n=1 Tax=Brachypodium distachyon TaxID=15368 RepID=A0A0Q3LD24_BRADI|nr:formin-like protein 14 [Brachypodium distachyon]KQJ90453.1 hypothetical protein BRADI_4g31645v3 [Brachypodium distachyon]|eukprot:XP_014757683.1 formin-like protein 14 [Brachypodium distachyon]